MIRHVLMFALTLMSCTEMSHNWPSNEGILTGIPVHILEPFLTVNCCPKLSRRQFPTIYCYKATEKHLQNIFMTAKVFISLDPNEYELYWGGDEVNVMDLYVNSKVVSPFSAFFWKPKKDLKLNPFNNTCLGIVTTKDYSLKLEVNQIDAVSPWFFFGGVCLFYLAPIIAPNPLLYYTVGVVGGVCASVFILFYFCFIKLMPLKKEILMAILMGGGSLWLIFIDPTINSLGLIFIKYQAYVTGYIVVAAVVSFLISYRFGPVTNPASINIIKWSLQAAAHVLLWASSHQKGTIQMIGVLLTLFYYVPLLQFFGRFSYRTIRGIFSLVLPLIGMNWILNLFKKPPQPRPLLSEEEYKHQGEVETAQAMEDLVKDFRTNKINTFEVLHRLSPYSRDRTLKLLTGRENHISNEEKTLHRDYELDFLTDDEENEEY